MLNILLYLDCRALASSTITQTNFASRFCGYRKINCLADIGERSESQVDRLSEPFIRNVQ